MVPLPISFDGGGCSNNLPWRFSSWLDYLSIFPGMGEAVSINLLGGASQGLDTFARCLGRVEGIPVTILEDISQMTSVPLHVSLDEGWYFSNRPWKYLTGSWYLSPFPWMGGRYQIRFYMGSPGGLARYNLKFTL